jgi:hypothetical protein
VARPSKGGHKRRNSKYPGLDPKMHPRTRHEYIDIDYAKKLTDEEKAYLSKFMDEYYGATLAPADSPGRWRKDLHRNKKLRKDCTDRNNARNRDTYSRSKARDKVKSITKEKETEIVDSKSTLNPAAHEDAIVALLDKKRSLKKSTTEES